MRFSRVALRLAALLLCAAAPAHAQGVVLRYPYLQNLRPDRATIVWTMLDSAAGAVSFSADQSFARVTSAGRTDFLPDQTGMPLIFYQYEAELRNLLPNTEYFYRITLNGIDVLPDDVLRFRTPSAAGSAFRFLAFGDSGTGEPAQIAVRDRMLLEPDVALVLHTGDIAYSSGTFSEFHLRHFEVYRELMKRVPFYPAPGNHEYWLNGNQLQATNDAAPFRAMHSLPSDGVIAGDRNRYYSYDWGNVHFIALDSNAPLLDAALGGNRRILDWLERDLQRTRAFWKIAYWHHPPYATGPNQGDRLSAMARQLIVPILERYGVQLVLNGHEHSYQRTVPVFNGAPAVDDRGIVYITTGGGGARLYAPARTNIVVFPASEYHFMRGEVQGGRITMRAIRPNGSEIDSVTIAPVPVISEGSTVNAASFQASVAPGSLVSIFGRHLASTEAVVSSFPLRTELGGVAVTLNGVPVRLLYVSPGQINAHLPFHITGAASLRVTTPNGSMEIAVNIAPTAPGIFSLASDTGIVPTVLKTDGSLVSSTSPARAGEIVTIYLTGLGAVDGPAAPGEPAPSSPLQRCRATVGVQIDDATVLPSYAGLTPGFAGLYQVNVRLPATLGSGSHQMRVLADGVASNSVMIEVREQ